MIQNEDVLETAQETGYRLCNCHDNGKPSQVFSSCWDPNDDRKIFFCHIDGILRIVDVNSKVERNLKVVFRRFTPSLDDSSERGKVVELHWDKMVLIPHRPNEVIFLLGISKSIYYTALPAPENNPYSDKPFLAKTSRSDYPDFIYGTPVLELWSHNSRVTSIAVSACGHLLASGDEQGYIRILLLRLLDALAIGQQEKPKRNSLSDSTLRLTDGVAEFKITVRGHSGPLFAMEWLPIEEVVGHFIFPDASSVKYTSCLQQTCSCWQ